MSLAEVAVTPKSGWFPGSLAVLLNGSGEVSHEIVVDQPFVRVGGDPRAEVHLPGKGVPARCLYLHATSEGVFALGIEPRRRGQPEINGWLGGDASLKVHDYELKASLVNPFLPPTGRADLRSSGSAGSNSPTLFVRNRVGSAWAAHRLSRALTLVGRMPPSKFRLGHSSVSAAHCVLYWSGSELWVVDLLSRNQTFLNGTPVELARVVPGDSLEVGEFQLSYRQRARGAQRRERDDQPEIQADAVALAQEVVLAHEAALALDAELAHDAEVAQEAALAPVTIEIAPRAAILQALPESIPTHELPESAIAVEVPASDPTLPSTQELRRRRSRSRMHAARRQLRDLEGQLLLEQGARAQLAALVEARASEQQSLQAHWQEITQQFQDCQHQLATVQDELQNVRACQADEARQRSVAEERLAAAQVRLADLQDAQQGLATALATLDELAQQRRAETDLAARLREEVSQADAQRRRAVAIAERQQRELAGAAEHVQALRQAQGMLETSHSQACDDLRAALTGSQADIDLSQADLARSRAECEHWQSECERLQREVSQGLIDRDRWQAECESAQTSAATARHTGESGQALSTKVFSAMAEGSFATNGSAVATLNPAPAAAAPATAAPAVPATAAPAVPWVEVHLEAADSARAAIMAGPQAPRRPHHLEDQFLNRLILVRGQRNALGRAQRWKLFAWSAVVLMGVATVSTLLVILQNQ